MLRALLSVQENVPDARTVIFVHAYGTIDAIPSELHPNVRLLDEAFPTITVESVRNSISLVRLSDDLFFKSLAFVPGCFNPTVSSDLSSLD